MRARRLTSVLILLAAWGCEGETCTYQDEHGERVVPIGYCGRIECNRCVCDERWAGGGVGCTLIGCISSDPCWRTGAHGQICSTGAVFEPCDLELTAEEQCYVDHGDCRMRSSGGCGFEDRSGALAVCIEAARSASDES